PPKDDKQLFKDYGDFLGSVSTWSGFVAAGLMVVFGLGSYYAKHMDAAAVLAMYSFAVVAFPVGMVGHRRKFAQRLMEAKERGESEDNTWPPAMMAQVFVSLVVFGTAAIWTTR
ncbi:hypothetical protein ACFRPV_28045, partial [Kitasatospora sp. NPDC056808]